MFKIVNRHRRFPSVFYIWSQYRICLNVNSQNREMGGESIGVSANLPGGGTPDPLRWHWALSMCVSREDRLALQKQLLALQPCTEFCPWLSPFWAWLVYISVLPFCGAGSSYSEALLQDLGKTTQFRFKRKNLEFLTRVGYGFTWKECKGAIRTKVKTFICLVTYLIYDPHGLCALHEQSTAGKQRTGAGSRWGARPRRAPSHCLCAPAWRQLPFPLSTQSHPHFLLPLIMLIQLVVSGKTKSLQGLGFQMSLFCEPPSLCCFFFKHRIARGVTANKDSKVEQPWQSRSPGWGRLLYEFLYQHTLVAECLMLAACPVKA